MRTCMKLCTPHTERLPWQLGESLNARLFRYKDEDATASKTTMGKNRSQNTPLIRDLVRYFIESNIHIEYGTYLVDSLRKIKPMTKDRECMTRLLDEPGKMKNLTRKQKQSVQDDKTKFIEHFIQTMSQLLLKVNRDILVDASTPLNLSSNNSSCPSQGLPLHYSPLQHKKNENN